MEKEISLSHSFRTKQKVDALNFNVISLYLTCNARFNKESYLL